MVFYVSNKTQLTLDMFKGNAIRGVICAAVVFVLSAVVFIYDRFNTRAIRAKLSSIDKKNVVGVDNVGVNQNE